jgi:hypothetical protein
MLATLTIVPRPRASMPGNTRWIAAIGACWLTWNSVAMRAASID